MQPEHGTFFQRQVLPIFLAVIACGLLIAAVYGQIHILNTFAHQHISLSIRWTDVLIGLTVYLKTSIDFALFIGNLMHANGGWKNRISIELGTALGNGIGTVAVLAIWVLFKQVDWLLAIMILLAAIVLFKLAETGLEHARHTDREYPAVFRHLINAVDLFLRHVNWFTAPLLRIILPNLDMNAESRGGFWSLFAFSLVIPFVLGLDDFAGYVPLFSLINVFGFIVGVFIAHTLLNIFLYISPSRTIKAVKNPIISFIGSIAFIGLGGLGLYEAAKLLLGIA